MSGARDDHPGLAALMEYVREWPDSDDRTRDAMIWWSDLLRTLCGWRRLGGAGELACKPDSVPHRRGVANGGTAATIHLDTPLPGASSGLPAGSGEQPSNACATTP